MRHPSDSGPQTRAEQKIIARASERLRCHLKWRSIGIANRVSVQVDGYSGRAHVLCEAFSHQQRAKGGQKNKPLADAFKLLFVEKHLRGRWRKVLAFADEEAARPFTESTWRAHALQSVGVEVIVVKLDPSDQATLIRAQRNQRMVNSAKVRGKRGLSRSHRA